MPENKETLEEEQKTQQLLERLRLYVDYFCELMQLIAMVRRSASEHRANNKIEIPTASSPVA